MSDARYLVSIAEEKSGGHNPVRHPVHPLSIRCPSALRIVRTSTTCKYICTYINIYIEIYYVYIYYI